jgi:chitinase
LIEALRDDIDLMMVQLYNSGSMLDLNGTERFQGTADFIISQTEAIIRGFTAVRGMGVYSGLPASKVVVALPSCSGAGSGAASTTVVANAINYLMGTGTKPGTYTLKQAGGYPDLRGMMTWSINNDRSNCTSGVTNSYTYAANYVSIFGDLDPVTTSTNTAKSSSFNWSLFPNPSSDNVSLQRNGVSVTRVEITNLNGQTLKGWNAIELGQADAISLDLNGIPAGIYIVLVETNDGNSGLQLVKE